MAIKISPARKKRRSKAAPDSAVDAARAETVPQPWWQSTFAVAAVGAVLLYLAFPLADLRLIWIAEMPWWLAWIADFPGWLVSGIEAVPWWLLAWIAPVPWLLLVRLEKLPGRRPYAQLYLVGALHWLVLLEWVRRGHWAAHFGWIALTLYLACYLPLFVGLTRAATGRLRVPLLIAAPAIWVGLEVLRSWLFTGLSIALLGHTQIHSLHVVQISDLGGAYLVSFLIMLVAAALAEAIPLDRLFQSVSATSASEARWWPAPVALAAVVATLCYGHWRLEQSPPASEAAPARIALVQGSIDTNFSDVELSAKMHKQYRDLTNDAHQQKPDAIFWPESTMPFQFVDVDRSGEIRKGLWLPQDDGEFRRLINLMDDRFREEAFVLGFRDRDTSHIPLLIGAGTLRLGNHPPRRLNSAVYVDEQGRVVDAYDKLHPVMFGEYAPGGKLFPWIYDLMPFPEGLTAGDEAKSFEIAGLQMCPSICYENTVPHLMRRQVAELRAKGIEPDVLVTLSNDGWFYGSAELDMHLHCGQFRAIELRKPTLVAANTGFSAHIGDDGRLLAQGPRRETQVVMAEVRPGWRESFYARWGDVFANTCLIFCIVAAIGGWARRHNPTNPDHGE